MAKIYDLRSALDFLKTKEGQYIEKIGRASCRERV